MKRIISFIFIIATLGVTSCNSFVEGYDVSPNSPTNVGLSLLLPAAELGLQSTYTSNLARNSSVFVQQLAGTKDQMLQVADYALREGDNLNEWNSVYNNIVQTSNDIIEKAGAENPYYTGIAKVIKAMGLGLATDTWGDVPAVEAGMGKINGNLTPKFDVQKDVMNYIQTLLNEAIANFAASEDKNKFLPGEDDFLYHGNITQWKNLAYVVKARYANRLNKKDAIGSATEVLNSLSKVVDFQDFMAVFGSGSSEINQWYAFENARADYLKMGKYFVDKLISLNDPRLPFYAAKNANGIYAGSPTTAPDLSASNIGSFIVQPEAPIAIATNVEVLFMKAEAYFRLSKKDLAATNYNDAIRASVKMVTGNDAPSQYIANYCSETEATISLEKIMTQKHLAMFANTESWVDWRRTGYPTLTPNGNGSVAGIPRRYPTVIDERTYNPNVIVVSDILKPVWWDTSSL